MNFVYFRRPPNESNIDITFHFKNDSFGIDRTFNFQRNSGETVETSLIRVRKNFEKELAKKFGGGKKRKPKEGETESRSPPEVVVQLLNAAGQSITSATWTELFAEDEARTQGLVLSILGHDFVVTYNYPYASEFQLPSVILVGFKCYPSKFEVTFAERNECLFRWYRGLPAKSDDDIEWVECGDSFFYEVQKEDVNHKLKVSSQSMRTFH